jgi:hypothetical protein
VEQEEKLSLIILHLYTILNSVISLGGGAGLCEFLMLIRGATLGRSFNIKIGRAA